eukprot:Em0305g11a
MPRAEKRFNALQQSGTQAEVPAPPISKVGGKNNTFLIQKLSDFKANHKMAELVLPAPLSEGDITCVVEAAPSLGLSTEMVMFPQCQGVSWACIQGLTQK